MGDGELDRRFGRMGLSTPEWKRAQTQSRIVAAANTLLHSPFTIVLSLYYPKEVRAHYPSLTLLLASCFPSSSSLSQHNRQACLWSSFVSTTTTPTHTAIHSLCRAR